MIHLLIYLSLCINSTDTLKWSNFKGAPDSSQIAKGFRASTHTQWVLTDSIDDGRVWFTVESSFVEEDSWTITDCPIALTHETTHFYISEIWADKCRKKIDKYQGCSVSRLKKAKDLYLKCWSRSRKLQALFDRETAHGTNKEMERIWEACIRRDLK